MFSTLTALLHREKKLLEQRLEIAQLQKKIAQLEDKNQRMRKAMRHCTTCDYRLEAKVIRRQQAEVLQR
ncbi:hypothetical protein [Sinobacterium norvegicum]|uniref:hypothetical protein n=1 Tax=Sinobacterium norvegicum TaxID=1641715 RepID=UPI001F29E29E|nr:hypothetical protein [Sinobacterium norvegicum]